MSARRRTVAALAASVLAGLAVSAPIAAHDGGNPTIGFRAATYGPASVRILPGQTVTWAPDAGTDFAQHPLVFEDTSIVGPERGATAFPHTFAAAGRYRFYCRFHGAGGMRGEVLVTVNDPPLTSFSAPLSAEQGAAVSFDASSSIDPNGQRLTYAWDFDGDRAFEHVSAAPTAVHVFPAPGTFTVGLRVTDSNDDAVGPESSTGFQEIAITPAPRRGEDARPRDVPPVVKLAGPRALRLRTLLRRGLAVRASASKAGLATATLRRGSIVVGRGSAGFVGAGTRTVTARLTASGRRSLRRSRPRTLRLTVVLVDAAGNDSRATVAVRLRR